MRVCEKMTRLYTFIATMNYLNVAYAQSPSYT